MTSCKSLNPSGPAVVLMQGADWTQWWLRVFSAQVAGGLRHESMVRNWLSFPPREMPHPPHHPPPRVQPTKAYPVLKLKHETLAWLYVLSKSDTSVTTSRKASQPPSTVLTESSVSLILSCMCPPQSP